MPVHQQLFSNYSMLLPASNRHFAVSEKSLKIRMKSVNSIRKITKAMKMVAASKMKGDLQRLERGKHFGNEAVDMIFKSDTYMQRRAPELPQNPKILLVPLTSDKGLCGGTNSGIVRNLREFVNHADRSKLSVFAIGDKGISGLVRNMPDLLKVAVSDVSKPVNYPTVMAIAEHIVAHGDGKDKIVVYYNEFKSAISSIIRQMELMPRQRFLDTMRFGKLYNQKYPDKNTSNPALYELYITSNLWVAFLNNSAAEQSARMTAMENASKNAKEILEKLKLQYNRARQTRITIELVEIISGASAL
jgi:F-type H+-transporting ATPase subunit gamma